MPKKVVTLGEILMRLSPPQHQRFVQTESFDITYGGGEANVAAALCNYGLSGVFVSRVPDNQLGQAAINHLRRYGVDTQYINRGGERLGIYFLETGASVRPSQVIYDRKHSSISDADIADFDFDAIFDGADWFHTSGITPAISDKAARLTEAALKAARQKGITTSLDVNYRKKLWDAGKAEEILGGLSRYVDVCIGADSTLGIHNDKLASNDETTKIEGFKELFQQLTDKYGFKYVTSTLRNSISASDNSLSALAFNGTDFHHSKSYDIRIVDRVGGGDSFASGFIYGLISGFSLADTTEFGVAASVLKHTIPGDLNHVSTAEVMMLLGGADSGRVQR